MIEDDLTALARLLGEIRRFGMMAQAVNQQQRLLEEEEIPFETGPEEWDALRRDVGRLLHDTVDKKSYRVFTSTPSDEQ